jgi:hypothetical protein
MYRSGNGCSCRVSQEAFERLEPIAWKRARWVLRGRGGGNVALLPDLDSAVSVKK